MAEGTGRAKGDTGGTSRGLSKDQYLAIAGPLRQKYGELLAKYRELEKAQSDLGAVPDRVRAAVDRLMVLVHQPILQYEKVESIVDFPVLGYQDAEHWNSVAGALGGAKFELTTLISDGTNPDRNLNAARGEPTGPASVGFVNVEAKAPAVRALPWGRLGDVYRAQLPTQQAIIDRLKDECLAMSRRMAGTADACAEMLMALYSLMDVMVRAVAVVIGEVLGIIALAAAGAELLALVAAAAAIAVDIYHYFAVVQPAIDDARRKEETFFELQKKNLEAVRGFLDSPQMRYYWPNNDWFDPTANEAFPRIADAGGGTYRPFTYEATR